MSITLLNLHKHQLTLSYFRKSDDDNGFKYRINGWYKTENKESLILKENDYISLYCAVCDYKYISEKNINTYTTSQAHILFFNKYGSSNLYTKYKQKVLLDNNYYLKNYYLINNKYKGILYVGFDEEIKDYLFSEMTKYKDLYDKEKSKNKFLNEEKQQKINRINDLSLNINNLNTKIDDLNTKNKKDNKQLNVLNEEIKQLKIKSEKKVNELNEKNISLKNEFKNKESIIQSEKNKLEVKAKKTQIENLKLMEENKELKEQNMTLQNFGIRYKTDHEEGDYDIILCVDSIKNLANNGWMVKYNKKEGKAIYEESKQKKTIVVGVVGNGNKGKSFLLKKLSDYNIPMGFNVKTEGLSIIYGNTGKKNLAILDSAGQETPLLIEDKKDKNIEGDTKDNHQLEFEEYSRDKLITEFYIQQFILWKSNIIILLVGSITLSEQKLYSRIKNEIMAIQENKKETKKLYVVHNLQNFYQKNEVNDYIENTLKKLYNVEVEEIQMYDPNNEISGYDKYFLEKDNKNIIHLLFINDYCEYSTYYNKSTIWYLTQAISQEPSRQTFEILENSKEFLLEISEEIIENKLKKEDIEITIDKESGAEKLIVKNQKELQLKKFIVDEMGITKNDGNTPKYSYYINTQKSKLVVNIEIPGGGILEDPKVISFQGYYSFRFEGEQNGELNPKYINNETEEEQQLEDYEDLDNEKQENIYLAKNLRKKHPIHLNFKISNQIIQLQFEDNEPKYIVENTKKGILIFIFDIILLNKNSGEKKAKKKIKI